ncbi:MAG: site-2 protease family protein [Candidatus Parcubacteria bacterium]|nr:site-2 protease family protein [Candidatus Parcubacteria bacterium]
MDSYVISLIVGFIAFFLALTVHEFSHALTAYYLGDRTAQDAGRLTLNPLAHIDLFGTVLLPLFLILSQAGIVFGWAKPVPVNYYNLKDQKWGPALVSLAGPAANLIFCVFCVLFWQLMKNYLTFSFNTLLVPFIASLIEVNIVLMVFNLIPIPPLDGSKILFAILPDKYESFKIFLERNGILILIIFIFFGSSLLYPLINFFKSLLVPFL